MDCNTGEIHSFDEEERAVFFESFKEEYNRELLSLNEDQVAELAPLPLFERKGRMRNKLCPCGSGLKFKRCCWDKHV